MVRGRVERSHFIEFRCRPDPGGGALRIERADQSFHFKGFGAERPAGAFPGGVLDFPSLRDQAEEGVFESEGAFDGEMREVVESKMGRLAGGLFLPTHGAVVAGAAEEAGAVGSLGDFDAHDSEISISIGLV